MFVLSDEAVRQLFDAKREEIVKWIMASDTETNDGYAFLVGTADSLEKDDELRMRILRALLDHNDLCQTNGSDHADIEMHSRISNLITESQRWME